MDALEYRIIAPKQVQSFPVHLEKPAKGEYLVKVTKSQVCDADAKYYFGLRHWIYKLLGFKYFYGVRDRKNFMSKYPLTPLHEALGRIKEAGPETNLAPGTRVVLIPSIPCEDPGCEYCKTGRENCCSNSRFMSSDAPGFARTHLLLPEGCVEEIPPDVPDEIAVYVEMATVAYGGILAGDLKKGDKIAVYGDGYMSFILSALLSRVFEVPREDLYVFGVHDDKLSKYSDFAKTLNTRRQNIRSDIKVDRVFECVGRRQAEEVVDSAISIIKPEGVIVLLGVSEEKIKINTRDVLSKSLTLRGVSRSPARHYPKILSAMKDPALQELFKRIAGEQVKINSEEDLKKCFESFMVDRKKVLMDWV